VKKGIILEQHRKYTVVLTKDGEFRKMSPIKDAEIGMEVMLDAAPKRKWGKQRMIPVSILAAACMFIFLFQMVPTKNTTYAYVVVDINPSLELEVTEDMKIHSVRPINEDAERLIEALDHLDELEINQAMDLIIDTSEEHGLMNGQKNILVGVSYSDEQEEDGIPEPIEEYVDTKKDKWNIASFHVPSDVREEAMDSNTSMNEKLAEKMDKETKVKEKIGEQEQELIHTFYNNEEDETMEEESKESVEPVESEDQEDSADDRDEREPEMEDEKELNPDDFEEDEIEKEEEKETSEEKDIKMNEEHETIDDSQSQEDEEEKEIEVEEEITEPSEEAPEPEQNDDSPINEEKELNQEEPVPEEETEPEQEY